MTLAREVDFEGIGLHSGNKAIVKIRPAVENSGIVFVRTDLPEPNSIPVGPASMFMDPLVSRCSVVSNQGAKVSTVEHILAALFGLGIDNARIEINGEEVPGLDGSARDFFAGMQEVGIVIQQAEREYITIERPIVITNADSSICLLPATDFKLTYTLEYDHPLLRSQTFSINLDQEDFLTQLAPARTFCLEREVPIIKQKGLGKGANEKNTLVMGNDGPIGNQLRFDNECCRHKMLDIVGDLFLLGKRLKGHVIAKKSGHAQNRLLVTKIMEQKRMSGNVYDIQAIMKILPHRQPFLLVDKVIVVEPGKRGIGIKNVSMNEPFFQGHFPTRPVMPGVLMVEAMAQAAGVVILTSGNHPDKVALFMAIEGVKFRKVVSPGDVLEMEIEVLRDRERTSQVQGTGRVGGEVVVEAQMLFSYADFNYLGD